MAKFIWFVPGFMGSTLGLYPTTGGQRSGARITTLWGTIGAIGNLDRVAMLELPSTLPAGQGIFADGLAPSELGGYSGFTEWLDANTPADMTAFSWPYDWRLSSRGTGLALALALENSAAQGNQNFVVSHSQGALTTWCAWAALVDRGTTAAMSRWITFGGALYGTSSTPNIFREQEDSLRLLAFAKAIITWARQPRVFPALPVELVTLSAALLPPADAQKAELIEMAASWPGLYDLYPDAARLDDDKDVDRGLLFDPTKWVAALVLPNFTLLQSAVDLVHTPIRQAKYLPPATVVSHIVGEGHATPWQVKSATGPIPFQSSGGFGFQANPHSTVGRLQRLPSFSATSIGDGRCTLAQQMFPNRYWQRVSSAHAAMQDDAAVRALILSMLTTPNPVQPAANPVSVTVLEPWVPPIAPTGLPQFVFNNDPVVITAPAPVLPLRVGGDP